MTRAGTNRVHSLLCSAWSRGALLVDTGTVTWTSCGQRQSIGGRSSWESWHRCSWSPRSWAGGILELSVILGASVKTGVLGALLVIVPSRLFDVAWAGTSFVPALLTKSEQATGTLSIIFFPVAFMSTAFVPRALMLDWLQTVIAWNPITFLLDAIRALMVSGYEWAAIGKALIAVAILGVIFQSVSLWAFRRLAAQTSCSNRAGTGLAFGPLPGRLPCSAKRCMTGSASSP